MRPILCLLAVAVTFVSAASPLAAQQPPYENPLAAEPPYYRVRYEASEKPGELIYPAGYTIWLPPGVETLRGVIVHQHGCGEGSCKSGQTGAYDLHWQALAKKHGCALLGPSYEQPEKADCRMWCDPRNGSDAAFQRALADLAGATGHPELAAVPWAIWGHSGGGYWAGGMVLLHPDRVAAAWLRSGVPPVVAAEGKPEPYPVPEAASGVPMMANLGTKEGVTVKDGRFAGVWGGVKTFFETMRGRGARLGVAVDPFSSHDCGNQRYLAIPWFDACLAARLPENAGAPLNPMLAADGYLAPLYAGEGEIPTPVPAPDYAGVSESASWLPGEGIANAWAQYVKDTAVADPTPPPAPTNLRVDGNVLRWDAEADLESGISHFLIERDGEVIGKVPENAKNPFVPPAFPKPVL
ncbi:MAG: hypothetical protein R3F11_01930 [Verrucomicrobiales bacterium]